MLSKMRAVLANHGLMAPARLSVLKDDDLSALVLMALPGEDLGEEELSGLNLWLELQRDDARRLQSIAMKADVASWTGRRYLAYKRDSDRSRALLQQAAEHAVADTTSVYRIRVPQPLNESVYRIRVPHPLQASVKRVRLPHPFTASVYRIR